MTSRFKRVISSITSAALIGAGIVAGSLVAAPSATAAEPVVGNCLANMAQTDFQANPNDPDLTGVVRTDLYMYMNKARAAAGIQPLARSGYMESLAAQWANTGKVGENLGHAPVASRTRDLVPGWLYEGENIFSGASNSTAYTIFNMWMNSETHRANILCSRFNFVGIGTAIPGGQTKLHVVQRFVQYPASIDLNDQDTWLPHAVSAPNVVSRPLSGPFVEDTTLTTLTQFQQEVLTEVNRVRAENGITAVKTGQVLTGKTQAHIYSLADHTWAEHSASNYAISNDPQLLSSLVGSGNEVAEMYLSRVTAHTGTKFVQSLMEKGGAWRNTILDPKWTHIGAARQAETEYEFMGFFFGLRFAAYPEIPVAVAPANSWDASPVTIPVGQKVANQVAIINGSTAVHLQKWENSSWKTEGTFTPVNGKITVVFPTATKAGSEQYRLFASTDNLYYLDWYSPVKPVTVTLGTQSNTWSPAGGTIVGEATGGIISGSTTAFIEAGGTVVLERMDGSSWVAVSTISVPASKTLNVPIPSHPYAGTYTYRLRHLGDANYKPWDSAPTTVVVVQKNQNVSFNTDATTVGINEHAASRALTTTAIGARVTLLKQSGNSWSTVSAATATNGNATVTFPVESGGKSVYRVTVEGDSRVHNMWTSGNITVTAEKKSQVSSWASSAATITFGGSAPTRVANIQAKGTIYLQEYVDGAWENVKSFSASTGKANVAIPKPSEPGTFKYRVYSAGNAAYNAWTSGTMTLTVEGQHQSGTIGMHDFNGDKKADMLWVNSTGKLYILQGNGKGKFSKKYVGTGYKSYKKVTATGDLSGDGHADMIQVTSSGVAYLVKGTGKNKFSSKKVKIATGWKNHKDVFSPGDLNGDKYGDIVYRTSAGAVYVMYGKGDGTFKTAKKLSVNWKSYASISGGGDYNRDNKADIILVAKNGKVTLARGTGKGTFKTQSLGSITKSDKFATIPGNVNGGTYADVMTMDTKGRLKIYPGKSAKALNKVKNIMTLGKKSRGLS